MRVRGRQEHLQRAECGQLGNWAGTASPATKTSYRAQTGALPGWESSAEPWVRWVGQPDSLVMCVHSTCPRLRPRLLLEGPSWHLTCQSQRRCCRDLLVADRERCTSPQDPSQPPRVREVPGCLTLQDTMNMVKRKMRLALDTGSQRLCCRVNRIAP